MQPVPSCIPWICYSNSLQKDLFFLVRCAASHLVAMAVGHCMCRAISVVVPPWKMSHLFLLPVSFRQQRLTHISGGLLLRKYKATRFAKNWVILGTLEHRGWLPSVILSLWAWHRHLMGMAINASNNGFPSLFLSSLERLLIDVWTALCFLVPNLREATPG